MPFYLIEEFPEPTVLDIVFYNEIRTVLELCTLEGNFEDQFPLIDLWLKYVSLKLPQLHLYDNYLT